jgi:hypothetical protein
LPIFHFAHAGNQDTGSDTGDLNDLKKANPEKTGGSSGKAVLFRLVWIFIIRNLNGKNFLILPS